MRMLATIAVGVATALSGVADAVAQNSGPVIVIPTRRDVPVVLYGRDVSYVVVESDWGLLMGGFSSLFPFFGGTLNCGPAAILPG